MRDPGDALAPEMAAETLLGLDNVPLELPIAGIGSRVLAAVLDYLIQLALQIVWVLVFLALGAVWGGGWKYVLYVAGAFSIDWVYFAGFEVVLAGRTPGKKALRLRVVTREGGTPAASALLVRNLVRLADFVIGVPLMVLDPLARRLGDRLAGTIVVHEHAAGQDVLLRRIPERWQAADVALVESLLARSTEMEAVRAENLARRLVGWIEKDRPGFLDGVDRSGGPVETLRRAFQAEKR